MVDKHPPTAVFKNFEPVSPPLLNMFSPFRSNMEKCTCIPLPGCSRYGFAIKVAVIPCLRATPLVIILKKSASSAANNAFRCLRVTSNCPQPDSEVMLSKSIPASIQASCISPKITSKSFKS